MGTFLFISFQRRKLVVRKYKAGFIKMCHLQTSEIIVSLSLSFLLSYQISVEAQRHLRELEENWFSQYTIRDPFTERILTNPEKYELNLLLLSPRY